MEDEITKTIQELKINKKSKVDFQNVTFVVKNKKNKLIIRPESSLTFDIISYALLLLLCFFSIAIGADPLTKGIIILAVTIGVLWRLSVFTKQFWSFSIDPFDIIYNQIVKKTTEEFTNKYGNVKFIENN